MISIQKAGLLTTIQDLGRYGYQKDGVIVSGAMDQQAHRIANLLVNNPFDAPSLEITLMGPVMEFQEDALISLCGGHLSPLINGEPAPMWRPLFVKKGCELRFGKPQKGFRTYMAIAGGFDIPLTLKSYSTYLRAGIGGWNGRAIEEGDQIPFGDPSFEAIDLMVHLSQKARPFAGTFWSVANELRSDIASGETIRVMEGKDYESFKESSRKAFFNESFTIDSKSDRMGYRLEGPALHRTDSNEMISEAVAFGTIQIPGDGRPIILLADRQTTGGYPKIAQIATVDLPKVAQLKPGESLTFKKITHKEALDLYIHQEKKIKQLELSITKKYH